MEEATKYQTTKCPSCGSKETHVIKTEKPVGKIKIRRHRCLSCGETFKSSEEETG